MPARPARADLSGLPGRWAVVEGFDGSGKSTTARLVAASLPEVPVTLCSHKELGRGSERITRTMREVASLLWPKEDLAFVRSLPSEYRVHLHAAWYNLFTEFVLRPRLAAGEVLLLDSWYYKFFAHLVVYGYDLDYLEELFRHVPFPDAVILLEPPVEEAWGRREYSAVELGVYMDYPELGRDSFVHYQSAVRDVLAELGRRHHWSVVRPAPGDPPETVAAAAADLLRDVLEGAAAPP